MSATDVSQKNDKRRPSRTPFEIIVDENSKPPLLGLKGDVDVAVAEKLHEQLNRLVKTGYTQLTIDCHQVTYFDSTGLSELVWVVNHMPEGKVKLVGCSARLIKLLDVTGLKSVFDLVVPEAA